MPVENKKIKDLSFLLSDQISDNDLFIISDISDGITKHSTAGECRSYMTRNVYSGSVSVPSSNVSISSSFAAQSINSISSSASTTSNYSFSSLSSSHSITASFALNSNVTGGGTTITTGSFYPINVSRSITGSNADTASHALRLVYNGLPNGIASSAISSSFSATASIVLSMPGVVSMTASHANVADQSYTSSFLYYDGVNQNGTSSHAITSEFSINADVALLANKVPDVFVFYGPYTSSAGVNLNFSHSYLRDTASFTPELGNDETEGWIYCRGSVTSSFTSSATLWNDPRYVYLVLKNQLTNTETVLDTQHFTMNFFTLPDGTVISGSFVSSFDLSGYSSSLSQSYSVYVSASSGVEFDFNRPPTFTVSTKAANFSVWGNDF